MAFEDGPYIQAACFCDNVIEDKNGVLSLIRIIDTVTHSQGGENPPKEMPQFPYLLKLVIMLKSGKARGRSDLKIIPEMPNGASGDPIFMTVHFEGEEKGHNVVANINFIFPFEGLYWFDIFLDDIKINSIPLRVKYNRVLVK